MICVAFPTIMDGLVLRWYADIAGYEAGRELALASRDRFVTVPACSPEIRRLADQAHSYLTVEYWAHLQLHPALDVSRWVTHKTVGGLSLDLVPLDGVAS